MIFLIRYDRRQSRLLLCEEYDESRQSDAVTRRLELELEAAQRGLDHELVLLEAPTKEHLYKTHTRYFMQDLSPLGSPARSTRRPSSSRP